MIYKRGGHWHVDVTVHGVRYREALDSTDRREALALEKKRVGEILAGKAASKSGREFARKAFSEAAKLFLEERKPHVAERTQQFEKERLKPLEKFFGENPLLRIKAEQHFRLPKSTLCKRNLRAHDKHGGWCASPDAQTGKSVGCCR